MTLNIYNINLVKNFLICFVITLVSYEVNADDSSDGSQGMDDEYLLFDDNTPKFDWYSFKAKETERLKPKANEFRMINYSPMSNKIGERWVLVTLRNTSTEQRFLKSEYLVATFANGEQTNPGFVDHKVDGGGVITRTIYFGINKFPIVLLENQP
jgi:hypothetical protein